MSETNTNTSSSSSSNSFWGLAFLVCNIIVLANTERDVFQQLNHVSYYDFIVFSLVLICYSYIYLIVLCCCSASINDNNSNCVIYFTQLFSGLSFLGLLICTYTFMGKVWHEDPNHSVLFYREYWSKEAMSNLKHIDNAPFYTMTDVLIRIYSFITILFTIALVPLGCCFGLMKYVMDDDKTPVSDNNFISTL